MRKTEVSLKGKLPIDRRKAALIAQAASKYESTITLEKDSVILNTKSMLGMLSQSMPKDGVMYLVVDGADEDAATKELCRVILEL